jgi:hypothetical protein
MGWLRGAGAFVLGFIVLFAGLFLFFVLLDPAFTASKTDVRLGGGWLAAVPLVAWLAIRLHEAESPPFLDDYLWRERRTRGRLVWLITIFVWVLTAVVVGLHQSI